MFKVSVSNDEPNAQVSLSEKVHFLYLPISIKSSYAVSSDQKTEKDKQAELEETQNFAEIIALVNQKYSSSTICRIVIADSLHRHTEEMKGKTATMALDSSLLAGTEWLKKNNHLIQRLTMPYEISHWNDWTTGTPYEQARENITIEYNKREHFFSSVNRVILKFIQGFVSAQEQELTQNEIQFDLQKASVLCEEYLLEELAVFKMWADESLDLQKSDHPGESIVLYPFGNSSVNKTIFNCFMQLCHKNFQLLNLIKADTPTSRKNQKKSKKRPTEATSVASSDFQPEEISSDQNNQTLFLIKKMMAQQLKTTITISNLTLAQQINFLQSVENYAHSLTEELASKAPMNSLHTERDPSNSPFTFFENETPLSPREENRKIEGSPVQQLGKNRY
ncbi:MAG: hypothetical protein LRY67_06070 [Gammaproteobacteria bacterium]|nr:hypothetical protein [Gammaproteobacteria bacterium]